MFNLVLLGISFWFAGLLIGYCGAWINDVIKGSQ